MSTVRANSITNSAGSGAPDFPNGLTDNGVAVATTADLSTINTALEFISSATINNVATVDFTGFDSSKYSDYVFSLDNVIPVTDATFMFFTMSVDGGSTFLSSYFVTSVLFAGTVSTSTGSNIRVPFGDNIGSDVNEFGVSGEVRLFGPDLAARTYATVFGTETTGSGANNAFITTAHNAVTTAVNAIRFSAGSGNLESGRITMYGVRKS